MPIFRFYNGQTLFYDQMFVKKNPDPVDMQMAYSHLQGDRYAEKCSAKLLSEPMLKYC